MRGNSKKLSAFLCGLVLIAGSSSVWAGSPAGTVTFQAMPGGANAVPVMSPEIVLLLALLAVVVVWRLRSALPSRLPALLIGAALGAATVASVGVVERIHAGAPFGALVPISVPTGSVRVDEFGQCVRNEAGVPLIITDVIPDPVYAPGTPTGPVNCAVGGDPTPRCKGNGGAKLNDGEFCFTYLEVQIF